MKQKVLLNGEVYKIIKLYDVCFFLKIILILFLCNKDNKIIFLYV